MTQAALVPEAVPVSSGVSIGAVTAHSIAPAARQCSWFSQALSQSCPSARAAVNAKSGHNASVRSKSFEKGPFANNRKMRARAGESHVG